MDFFDQQDAARRASRWLLLWYALAVVFVVACFNLAVALVYAVFALYGVLPLAGGHASAAEPLSLLTTTSASASAGGEIRK